MDGKFNINSNKTNIKSEIDKKNKLKIFYNNITNSSKKQNTKISIFSSKLNINKKEKRKNIKNEMTLNITTKKHSKKKRIITEKKEKNIKSSKNNTNQKINNKSNKKNKIKKVLNNNNIINSITYQNHNINNNINYTNIKDKILTSKSNLNLNLNLTKSLSILNTPPFNDNSELDDVITSYEISPSELKTPKTLSEDSFILNSKEKENIKVNIKTSEIKDIKEEKEKDKVKEINTTNKIRRYNSKNKKLLDSYNIHSTKNVNNKLRINNKTFNAIIPMLQKNIKVKKNQILNLENSNDISDTRDINNENNNINNTKKIEEKNKPIQELKKNLSNHSIKFCLNQRLAKLKKIKNKLNKISAKIHINNNLKKNLEKNKDDKNHEIKEDENRDNHSDILTKNIGLNEKKNKNKRIQKEKIVFKINTKLAKKSDITNTTLNRDIKLTKENKNNVRNNSVIFYFQKNSKMINKNNNTKLALNIDNSNSLENKNNKLLKNMSGNNIIYAPKKGIKGHRSQEKNIKNIYSNMSYNPDKLNGIFRKKNNIRFIHKKEAQSEKKHFIEKNNSYCGNLENFAVSMENDNNLYSPRVNSINQMPKMKLSILNSENNTDFHLRNRKMDYINRTSEKIIGDNDNNLFMPNRFTTSGKINSNNYNYFQNQHFNNNSLNIGVNLSTDSNEYNLNNIFNRRPFINQMNIFPQDHNFPVISPFNNNINQTNLINLYNNNYLNFNTIQGRPSYFISNTNLDINDPLYPNPIENISNIKTKSTSINIEDIIILQEKLKYIILALSKKQMMSNECFEFFNFYYNSSIYCQLEKSFTNIFESNNVRISINCALISIIICYDYSFESEIMTKINKVLLNIIQLNYKNLIIIYEHILSKISKENKNNIWVQKLSNIINSYKKTEENELNNISKISLINYNTNIIYQNLILILINFPTIRKDYFLNFIENLSEKSYSQINIFFLQYIFRTNNIRGSILASELLRLGKNKNFVPIPNPYVRTKNNKNFSLVLDLDETLVHFKETFNEEGNGVLKIRPGINEFLEEVGKYYELIIFTTATQDYADTLIDAIEEDKIYFEHRFYRNHAIIINNDFVKDLTRIGRPLDKIIIIDNMPQNFRLQKENGIMIKAFWGEDGYDTALYDLIPILVNIAKDGGDVRKGLVKYKEDILKKISSGISKDIL